MKRIVLGVWLGAALALTGVAAAAGPADVKEIVREFYVIPSATGNEESLAAKIASLLPKNAVVDKDNLGSLFARVGPGEAPLAFVAALDEFGYAVSNITADGYLQLDRLSTPPVGIFDSFLMGHPVVISTKAGLRQGVVVQPAMHVLTPEMRDRIAKNLTLDMIYVDIGARSEAEARAKGVEILDSVTFYQELATLANGRLAGPALGQKAACAALSSAADVISRGKIPQAVSFGWMAQSRLVARGSRSSLGAVRAKNKLAPKETIIVGAIPADRGEKSPVFGKGPVLVQAKEGPSKLRDAIDAAAKDKGIALQYQTGGETAVLGPFLGEGLDAVLLVLPVKFAGTPTEVVDMKDVQAVVDIVAAVGTRRAK